MSISPPSFSFRPLYAGNEIETSRQFADLVLDEQSSKEVLTRLWNKVIEEMDIIPFPGIGNVLIFNLLEKPLTISSVISMVVFFECLKSKNFIGISFDDVNFEKGTWNTILSKIADSDWCSHLMIFGCQFNIDEDRGLVIKLKEKIKYLELNNLVCTEENAKVFISFLENNSVLNFLKIVQIKTDSIFNQLSLENLSTCSALEELHFEEVTLSFDEIKQFSKAIKQIKLLRGLTLIEVYCSERMDSAIMNQPLFVEWQEAFGNLSLKKIVLNHNCCGIAGEVFFRILENHSLERLEVIETPIDASEFVEGLKKRDEEIKQRDEEIKQHLYVEISDKFRTSVKEQLKGLRFITLVAENRTFNFPPIWGNKTLENQVNAINAATELYAYVKDSEISQNLLDAIKNYNSPYLNDEMTLRVRETAFIQFLLKLGLGKGEANPDGNCLFHSFSTLLKLEAELAAQDSEKPIDLGAIKSPSDLRKETVSHMRSHGSEWVSFIAEGEDIDSKDQTEEEKWSAYCDKMSDDSIYAGPIEIASFADIYKEYLISIIDLEYAAIDDNGKLIFPDGTLIGPANGIPLFVYRYINHYSPMIQHGRFDRLRQKRGAYPYHENPLAKKIKPNEVGDAETSRDS